MAVNNVKVPKQEQQQLQQREYLCSSFGYSCSSSPYPSANSLSYDGGGADADDSNSKNSSLNDDYNVNKNHDRNNNRQQEKRKKRILIIDDEIDMAIVFKFGLELKGFEVDAFTDPFEALSNFKPNHYHAIVSDVRMPNIDGFELCKELLKIDSKVKVFFVSAYQIYMDKIKVQYPFINYKNFIDKPVSISKLANIIAG